MITRDTIDFSTFPVTCPVCGRKVPRIDTLHAREHGYKRIKDFKEAHGITYETLLQRTRQKLFELYNIDRTRWCTVYWPDDSDEPRYVTKTYAPNYDHVKRDELDKSATRFPLSDSRINQHLTGKAPLAIFPFGDRSRFFGFDVDTREDAMMHALQIVDALVREGIPREYIHVSMSGGKGMHVEIFIDKHIECADWAAFGLYIIDRAGLNDENIEFRPEAKNGRAWKLPLTFHHKTGNFAAFLDPQTYLPLGVLESHDYLFAIRPMPVGLLFPVLNRAKEAEQEIKRLIAEERRRKRQAVKIEDKRVFQTNEEKRETVEKRLSHGLVKQGTRWITTRDIVTYLYHEKKMSPEQIRAKAIEWTIEQIDRGLAKTPLDECIKEIDDLIRTWLPKTTGFYSTVRELSISRAEIDWVLSIYKFPARDLLWALLLKYKAYGKDGTFYAADRDLQKLLCKPKKMSLTTISKARRWLIDRGYIEADIPKPGPNQRKATTYRLLFEAPKDTEIIDTVEFEDGMDCRALLRTIAAKLYDENHLKRMKLG